MSNENEQNTKSNNYIRWCEKEDKTEQFITLTITRETKEYHYISV